MAQMNIFNIVGNGRYLLNLKGSAVPNGYSALSLTSDSDIKALVESLVAPLYASPSLLSYAKSLVNMPYPVEMRVLGGALQSAIKQKILLCLKRLQKIIRLSQLILGAK